MLRDQHTCHLMRGATVTTWTLAAGTILLLAVIAFVPRNSVNPGVVSSGAPIAVALRPADDFSFEGSAAEESRQRFDA